jgi:hypothetical protein
MAIATLSTLLGVGAAGATAAGAGTAGAVAAGTAAATTAGIATGVAGAGAGIGAASGVGATGALGAIGTATSIAGTALGVMGQFKQAAAAEKAEEARRNQMTLEANRGRRAVIREAIATRSLALATATQQGAEAGSALPGASGQIIGRAAESMQGINFSEDISNQIFDANAAYARGGMISSLGSGLRSFGSDIASSAPMLNRLGTYYRYRPYGVNASY